MNELKAQFFDTQASEQWAMDDLSPEELRKISRMFHLADIRPGMKILEPGCGTGRLTELLAERVGPAGMVVALDISPGMVEACRRRISDHGNVRVFQACLEELNEGPASFDLVVCHNVYPHFDDKTEATKKLAAALQPTGKLIVFHFMDSAWINDMHRKTHPSVREDLIPGALEMARIFSLAGLRIDFLEDGQDGYLLSASLR